MSILVHDHVNAFCRHTHVALPGDALGPLAGLTFGLKDIYDVAGHKTGFGSPDWLRTHDTANAHASVTARMLHAGATMVGKTHTEEMAFSLSGENFHYGTPINVAAPGRIPGGSSSGSAAAVAAELVDFAIGSDTGGSVRAPASFCGVYGIRPTHGRIPLDGVCPLAPLFDTCGWFARDANLLARIGDVLLGGQAATPGRVLIAQDAFDYVLPEAARALQPALERVTRVLGAAERVTVSDEGLADWYEVFRMLQFGNIWETHGEWVMRVRPTFGPIIQGRFDATAQITAHDVARMTERRRDISARLDAMLRDNAIMLLPTAPDIAPIRDSSPEDTAAFRTRALGLLCIAGLGGLPQVSLPIATLQGCPLGLSMIAARGNDEMLLNVARQLS